MDLLNKVDIMEGTSQYLKNIQNNKMGLVAGPASPGWQTKKNNALKLIKKTRHRCYAIQLGITKAKKNRSRKSTTWFVATNHETSAYIQSSQSSQVSKSKSCPTYREDFVELSRKSIRDTRIWHHYLMHSSLRLIRRVKKEDFLRDSHEFLIYCSRWSLI